MAKFCKKCGKIMKRPKLSHCSDECAFVDIKESKSLNKNNNAELWDEKTDPWK